MGEIELPPELAITEEHGKVSWAVKSIWEYYATWFHFDKTTELYNVPMNAVYGDIAELAGADALVQKAQKYLSDNKPLEALHLVDIVLEKDADHKLALLNRQAALQTLLEQAKATTNNSYEIYWLNYRIRDTQTKLDAQ